MKFERYITPEKEDLLLLHKNSKRIIELKIKQARDEAIEAGIEPEKVKYYSYRLNELNFKKKYGIEKVFKDIKYVEDKERYFEENDSEEEKQSKTIAEAMEIVISDQIELANWLSQETYTYQASKYDDIKNGIDAVLEFINEDEKDDQTFLGVAFDITYKNNPDDKFRRIKDDIKNHKKNHVKYFKSETGNYSGSINGIVKLVIGLDIGTASELEELYLQSSNDDLGNHFFQFQLIDELLFQLEIFIQYSKEVGNKDASNSYEKIKEKILEIKEDKKNIYQYQENNYLNNFYNSCRSIFND